MKIFRFWSTFDPSSHLTPTLADLVDLKTPEDMAGDAPLVLTSASDSRGAFGAGIVLGIIAGEVDRAVWGDRLKTIAAETPIRLPGAAALEAVFFADPAKGADLQDWMVSRLSAAARGFAEEAATAGLVAGQLRIRLENYEQLVLEKRIDTSSLFLRQIVASDGATRHLDPDGVELTIDPAIGALHAFDLLLESDGTDAKDSLRVDLTGLDTGSRIASWTLQPESGSGWHQFWVPFSTIPSQEICQIRVRAAQRNSRWSIALGTMDQRGFFSAGLAADAPAIACRVWERAAACESPPAPLALIPDGIDVPQRGGGRIEFLASDLVAHAVAVNPRQQDRLQWRDDVSAFQLHPSGRRPVVACLRGVTVADVETITADVILAHPDAQDTKFALWAAPSEPPDAALSVPAQGRRWKLAARAPELAPQPVGLRWLTLAGGEGGILNFRFEHRHSGEIDVFIATCNRTEKSDFAWALFKRIVIQ